MRMPSFQAKIYVSNFNQIFNPVGSVKVFRFLISYGMYNKILEDFKIRRKLSFYQNTSIVHVRLSILASSSLSNRKNYQKNELRKAGQRFVKAPFLTACAKEIIVVRNPSSFKEAKVLTLVQCLKISDNLINIKPAA